MNRIYLIIALLICSHSFAQAYLDKDFYLLDSLQISDFEEEEREMMDSLLGVFHSTGDEKEKLKCLDKLIRDLRDIALYSKFNEYRLNFCYHRMFSRERSIEDQNLNKVYFARGLNSLGSQELDQGSPLKSLDYYFTSLEIIEDIGEADDYALVYTNIGTNYFHQGDIDQSKTYLQLAYDSLYKTTDKTLLSSAINNLAVIHQEEGEIDSSLRYHFQSLELSIKEGNKPGEAMSYNNIGGIYASSLTDSTEKGIVYLKKALVIFKELDAVDWISFTYHKLALAQKRVKEYESAEVNSNFALLYAIQANQPQPLLRAYRTIYEVKKDINKKDEALTYYEKYTALKDSVYSNEVKDASSQKELEYQYKAEKEIAEKEAAARLEISEAKSKKQIIITYGIIIVTVIIIGFVLLLLRRIKQINNQKAKIESQSEERKVMLKEIHHRVKNNFQIVCSVLRLQAHDEDNEFISRAFEDAVNRIQSMAEVHEMIYKEESFVNIQPIDYFKKLTKSLIFNSFNREVDYEINSKVTELEIGTMISLGISINELITNSLKHAFTDEVKSPLVTIDLFELDNKYILKYSDNGVGFDVNKMKTSFGTELIEILIEQIQGELEYMEVDSGISVEIKFQEAT